jgi:hypothetical protein
MAPQDLSNRILGLLQATSLDFTIISATSMKILPPRRFAKAAALMAICSRE